MCGIAGWICPTNKYDYIKTHILEQLDLRGRDGWGYSGFDREGKHIKTRKFLDMNKATKYFGEAVKCPIVVTNSRAVPTNEFQFGAGVDIKNQQPFSSDRYSVVFNGTIANDKQLIEQHALKVTATVDTAVMPPLFDKAGVVVGLTQINGSFAVCIFDSKERMLWFGSNFVPLHYLWKDGHIFVASLREMFPPAERDEVKQVPPYTAFSADSSWGGVAVLRSASLYRKAGINHKVLVVCSGGIDSTTTAWLYKHFGYDVQLLHFQYGQAAQEVEHFCVQKLAEKLGTKAIVFDARPVFANFKGASRLLNQTKPDPNLQQADAEGVVSYVPNRNAIFANIAAGLAEQHGLDTIAIGAQLQDAGAYPDNNLTFVDALDRSLKYSLSWQTCVRFRSPLIHLIKHEIVRIGAMLGVPFEWVCSCYYPSLKDGKPVACGKCGCCTYRFNAFKMLGMRDEQFYEWLPTKSWWRGCKRGKRFKLNEAFLERYVRPNL